MHRSFDRRQRRTAWKKGRLTVQAGDTPAPRSGGNKNEKTMNIEKLPNASGFSDRRVFFVHDAETVRMCANGGNMCYEQSENGPTVVSIVPAVSDSVLAKFADRHGLVFVLDELREFRDQSEVDTMLATPAVVLN